MNKLVPRNTLYGIFTFILFVACATSKEAIQNKNLSTLIQIHEEQRKCHIEKDYVAFVNMMSDDFVSVNNGKIYHPTKQENLNRFKAYFDYVEFEEWDDLTPPIIQLSDDGSFAQTIVHKSVLISYPDTLKRTVRDSTIFAWTAGYKKVNGEWKICSVTSTNKEMISKLMDD